MAQLIDLFRGLVNRSGKQAVCQAPLATITPLHTYSAPWRATHAGRRPSPSVRSNEAHAHTARSIRRVSQRAFANRPRSA